jgi:hypothetical protein
MSEQDAHFLYESGISNSSGSEGGQNFQKKIHRLINKREKGCYVRGFGRYMRSDGWVWVGVFVLVCLMQGRFSPVFQSMAKYF